LLGEHRELHAIWNIITKNKKGYSKHPETQRWKGRLKALYTRHEMQTEEMKRRGFKHNSPLDPLLAQGKAVQDKFVDQLSRQEDILRKKNCGCRVPLEVADET
jgi:hypothetical protein